MTAKYAILTCLLFLAALAGACERTSLNSGHADAGAHGRDGSPTVEVSPLSQPPIGGQCPAGFSGCGKVDGLRCYDLSQSQDHCGTCGNACAQGIACQAGTCQQYRCKGALSFKTLVFGSAGVAQTLGDFDGDGILDLVGSAEAGDPMSVLYGAGDGTFPTQQVIDPSLPLGQARAADLDGDGLPDLISIDGYTFNPVFDAGTSDSGWVTVRHGTGNRGAPFGETTRYPTTSSPLLGPLLVDLDADGRLDLVAGSNQGLEYWLGQDGGRFAHQPILVSADMAVDEPGIPIAMDWNGDGILDLIYSDFGFGGDGFPKLGGYGHLRFRLGHGDGTFDSEVACALITGMVGDLDNDHRPDLISGSTLLLGIDACHASKVLTLPDWPKQGGIALADFNGDGNLDVVADDNVAIMVSVGDGKGGFPHVLTIPAPTAEQWTLGNFLVGDLNGDGKLDVVFAREGGWGVLLNTCQ
jgi:hypothetical protein